MTSIISTIVLCACLLISATASAASIERVDVWKRGTEGYQVYRIPSLLVTKAGTVLAICEGRQTPKGNDSGEINLLVKRSTDGGKTFGPNEIVWADGKNTCGNPCPVVDQSTGTIWMLMTRNNGEDHEKDIVAGKSKERRTAWITSSEDDGKTWAKPREITDDVMKPDWRWYATGPGVGIQIQKGDHAGRLVIPCDYTKLGGGKGAGNSHVIYSDDHGKTWKIGGEAPETKFNESQIVELPDGKLMLNMRNGRPADVMQRGVCISEDGGETFKDLRHDATLIEPICQGSITRWKDSILFSNPASDAKRVAMTVRKSDDAGKTWAASREVFAGPSAYSCLAVLPDGSIGLLYECGEKNSYEKLALARFPVEWLSEK